MRDREERGDRKGINGRTKARPLCLSWCSGGFVRFGAFYCSEIDWSLGISQQPFRVPFPPPQDAIRGETFV